MDPSIRQARETDLPAVLRLYSQRGMDDATVLTTEAATGILRRMERYPDYAVYVAIGLEGTVIGTFALLIMDNLAHMGAPSAIVEDVCVDERSRGQGVGRAMMSFALELARERRCYKLTLSSSLVRDGAHAFYRALGFEQHGISFQVPLR